MPSATSPLSQVKALVFDVFGTVVDWRSSITEELSVRAFRKSSSPELIASASLRSRLAGLREEDWGRFTAEWHMAYALFCRDFDPARDEWKSIDEFHKGSLARLLEAWELGGLFTEQEIESLSLVWHRLAPWPESSAGLEILGKQYQTSTLSNGNLALLKDLTDFGSLRFTTLLSAETFHAYKPNPIVYQGAAEKLGLRRDEVAMVAAHLSDLKAAKESGLRTIFVERPRGEEYWAKDDERYIEAKDWVDLWIGEEEGGFLTLAEKLSSFQ